MRSLFRIVVSAFALWLTTLIVGGSGPRGVWVEALGPDPGDQILALLLVAVLFGLVNGTLGRVVRFVSFPLTILTLGLFLLIINGLLFAVVAWISDLIGFGLRIDGFWWGVLAALVMSVLSSIANGLLGTSKKHDRD